MCNHKKIVIIPSVENSWGIADTYHIKCLYCNKLLYENITSNELKKYVKKIHPSNTSKVLKFL